MDWQNIDWKTLLTSFHGRIDRVQFWIGFAISVVIALVGAYVGSMLARVVPSGWILSIAVAAKALFPAAAVAAKRIHDRDKPDFWLVIYFGPYLLSLVIGLFGIPVLVTIVSLASLAAFLYMAYDLGWLEGTKGPNWHGPAPAKPSIAKAA